MRLIDANALKAKLANELYMTDSTKAAFRSIIHKTPTVDAVEVVHGRWERLGEADYKCSECGFRFTSGDPISMFLFCRCGAKMDKETKFVGICERCEYRDECDWPKLHPKIELKKCPDFNEGEKNKNG